MKLLFSSYYNPNFMSFSDYIEKAINKLGHQVATFDWYKFIMPGRIRSKLPLLQALEIKIINNALLKKIKNFRPKILLIAGGFTIHADTISLVKQIGEITSVNWSADYPRNFEYHLKAGNYYDYLFISASDGLRKYIKSGKKNGRWLPFACDPDIHKPTIVSDEEKKKYSCDICFVGSNYPKRVEILEKLCGFNLGIWGIGWDRLPSDSPLKPHIRGGALKPEEWTKVYSCSKIALNILSIEMNDSIEMVDSKYGHLANTKVFEILGCGAFQLVERKTDVIKLFKNGEHLVYYDNCDQLIELIKHYLNNPFERKRIGYNGRNIVLEKHTYLHRINEIISIVDSK